VKTLAFTGGPFQFVVFGDSGIIPGRPDYPNNVILSSIIQDINQHNPALAVYAGDGTEQGGPISNMYFYREELSKLKVQYYPVIGNHEVSRGAFADGTQGDGEENFIKVFADRLPNRDSRGRQVCYYSFDYQDSHFIVLNTAWQHQPENESKGLYPGGEQWQWLVRDLKSSRQRSNHIFIICHEPHLLPDLSGGVFIAGDLNRFPVWYDAKAIESFRLLCHEYRVDAVFSGHLHAYANFKDGDITHIITGGAGSNLHLPSVLGGYYHFVICTVSGEQVQYEAVRLEQ
jgi:3',5'-cyclic AMP phosphodiesterase CpdA